MSLILCLTIDAACVFHKIGYCEVNCFHSRNVNYFLFVDELIVGKDIVFGTDCFHIISL